MESSQIINTADDLKEKPLTSLGSFPQVRMRRLRQHPRLRDMVRETSLQVNDLVLPLFITAGQDICNPISSLCGHSQWSVDRLDAEIASIVELNIPAVILFGIPEKKDAQGSAAWNETGVIQQAIRRIKQLAPDLLIIADVCCCEYTDHGHCGVLCADKPGDLTVANDPTLDLLVKQAVSLAQAGADIIAPSGMMDGMVQAIRVGLDQMNFENIPILSYAAKYASCFYGPFREAAQGAPQFGDRRGYQMDPANHQRALREAQLDVQEGADMIMVKPAMPYLDVIYAVKQQFSAVPLCAYQVSGEYAMIKAAVANGWLDESKAVMESLISIKRAGADFIISYYAKVAATMLPR